MSEQQTKNIVFVTGLSGSGMSSVLKNLEDLGYEVFDNFPLSLINPLFKEESAKPIAVGIDTRTRGFSCDALLEAAGQRDAQLVFVTCDDNALLKRFTETRRRHPLAGDQSLSEGIKKERHLLGPLQSKASLVIDTTHLSVHDLRHMLEGRFKTQCATDMAITLMSFGFKNGLPREADIVMDVRFARNPHWDENLKPKTGMDGDVQTYISEDDDFTTFLENFKNTLTPLIPRYIKEGKNYLTIAIGCTGGRHRSVFAIENMAQWLKSKDISAHIVHRDLAH